MKKKLLGIVAFLSVTFSLFAQEPYRGNGLGGQVGYYFQDINRIDLGANYLMGFENEKSVTRKDITYSGMRHFQTFGGQFNVIALFNNDNFYWGQKTGIGYAFSHGYYNFGSGVNFFVENYSKKDIRIGIDIGITFGTIFFLNYAYSYPIAYDEIPEISRHRIGLAIVLNRVHFDGLLRPQP